MSLDALIESLNGLTSRLQRSIVSDGYFETAFSPILELAAQVGLNASFDVKDRTGAQVANYGTHPSEVKGKVDLRNLEDRGIEAEVRVQKVQKIEGDGIEFEDILRKLFSAVGSHWAYRDARSMLPFASAEGVSKRILQSLYEQSQEARWFAVLHSDLDKFKEINSGFGYETGDKAIREFSDRIRAALSATGIVVRTGGDEMAAFIFSDDPNLFFDCAESLRRTMESEPLAAIGRPNTCSIGLAIFETADLPADLVSITRLVSLATPREVVEKSGGRNRISLPNGRLPPTERLNAQDVLDDIRYCALVSRRDIPAEAPKSLGSPVLSAVARLLSDRFQKLEVEPMAIKAAIAKVLENINILISGEI